MIVAVTRLGPVLDLGCGTGLVAVALSDLPVGPIVGVDVSSRMLAQAAAKQALCRAARGRPDADAGRRRDMLEAHRGVRCVGLLWRAVGCVWLPSIPDSSRAAGLIFTVEELLPDDDGNVHGNGDWALGGAGRYAHSMPMSLNAAQATGFTVRTLERQTLRHEGNSPVAGLFVVLERAA